MAILEKITDRIYAHTDGETIGNVGIIVGEDGNYVIDTSMYPVMSRQIRTEVEQLGTGKVLGAILTHYHFDHSGGSQAFHDTEIHAHKYVFDNMQNNYDEHQLKESFKEREDKELFEGMSLTYPTKIFETNPYNPDDSEQVEVYQVGGHTSGSSLIYYREEDTVFAGDNLFAGLFPWGGDPSASPYDWLNACQFLFDRDPSLVVPGHGPVQHNLKEIMDLHTYLTKVIDTGEKLVREGVDAKKGVETLAEINSKPEKNEGMKQRTLDHWYNVIQDHE